MGTSSSRIPALSKSGFFFTLRLAGRLRLSLSWLPRRFFSIAYFLFIRMQIQEGTFCALCFIAADDTMTPDTPREHKLKEV